MTLKNIMLAFKNGNINKRQYIDEMYCQHALLFEYSHFISDTNISCIEIRDEKVIMTFRDSGIKFVCNEKDKRLAPLDTLNFGSYEMDEMKMHVNLIDDGMNIFDIGANLGWFSLYVSKAKSSSQIFSFEPIPATFKCLNENILLNKISNINTFNMGFSEKEGIVSLFFDPSLSVNASLTNVSEGTNIQEIKCNISTLDNFLIEKNIRVDYIKCDVEGAELLTFKGGIKTIEKNKPIVFSEMLRKWTEKFSYHPNEIINLFREIGYECFVMSNDKLQRFDMVDENTKETNYFFLHLEKHKNKISKYSIK